MSRHADESLNPGRHTFFFFFGGGGGDFYGVPPSGMSSNGVSGSFIHGCHLRTLMHERSEIWTSLPHSFIKEAARLVESAYLCMVRCYFRDRLACAPSRPTQVEMHGSRLVVIFMTGWLMTHFARPSCDYICFYLAAILYTWQWNYNGISRVN